MLKKREPRRIFEPKREEVKGDRRKLFNGELLGKEIRHAY
jgi:hypothetical protein